MEGSSSRRNWHTTVDQGLGLLAEMPSPLSGRFAVMQSQLELVAAEGETVPATRQQLVQKALARLEDVCPQRPLLAGSCSNAMETAHELLEELVSTSSPSTTRTQGAPHDSTR